LALDIAGRNRVADTREHDWDGAGRLQQWRGGGAGRGQYDIRRERDQFGRVFAHGVGLAVAPTIFDADVLPDNPSPVVQALGERCQARLAFRVVCGEWRQHADAAPRSPCCAPAPSGHAAAAPPSSVMNSRRLLIQSPRRRAQAADPGH
jgi:hypothetical protein